MIIPLLGGVARSDGVVFEKRGNILELKNGRPEIRHILLIAIAYFIFSIYAIFVNGVGTNAPVMMNYYQINAAEQGFLSLLLCLLILTQLLS